MSVFEMLQAAAKDELRKFGFVYMDGMLTINHDSSGNTTTVVEADMLLVTINVLLSHTPDRNAALADLLDHLSIPREIIESLD